MPTCALCLLKEADKKGSHLVPHFLMKTVDNIDDKIGRDLELGFEMGKGHVKGYFGGSVLPERLEPVFGEITEEDIQEARSSMIVDYLLCTNCENRLAKLESNYSNSLKTHSENPYISTEDSFHSLIFWLSIFWRLSVSEKKVFKLSEKHEQQLRLLIDEGLDAADIDAYIAKAQSSITPIGYKVLRCVGYTAKNSAFVFLNNANDHPYCMLVGEFACFLFMDHKEVDKQLQKFLGLETVALKVNLNTCFKGEEIFPLAGEIFSEACRQVVEIWKEDFLAEVSEMCDKVHMKFIGSGKMHPAIKSRVIFAIANDENPLGRKYTIPAIVDAITKTLIMYEPYRSIAERM